ncbi:MAG TPA: peptidoglycan-associated lipoprotein Pal [Syntrophales bacterium]|nr:peptidoglycan-associated lipoprotein Pal [Syntrophales bacterium]
MKRKWGLALLALLVAVVFVSGCAKKPVLQEPVSQEPVLQEEKAGAKEPATVQQQAGDVMPPGEAKPAEEAAESRELKETVKEGAESASKPAETAEAKTAEAKTGETVAKKKEVAAAPAKDLYEFADIHFDFDKFNLREEDRAILKKHADWLNGNKDVTISVEGHCDERGTAEYNLALGERRANAAAKFLIDLGIDAKRIKTISYGKELPLNPGHNEEAWAMNRRAHFVASAKK